MLGVRCPLDVWEEISSRHLDVTTCNSRLEKHTPGLLMSGPYVSLEVSWAIWEGEGIEKRPEDPTWGISTFRGHSDEEEEVREASPFQVSPQTQPVDLPGGQSGPPSLADYIGRRREGTQCEG